MVMLCSHTGTWITGKITSGSWIRRILTTVLLCTCCLPVAMIGYEFLKNVPGQYRTPAYSLLHTSDRCSFKGCSSHLSWWRDNHHVNAYFYITDKDRRHGAMPSKPLLKINSQSNRRSRSWGIIIVTTWLSSSSFYSWIEQPRVGS